jgi:hypothetical protein
MSGKKRSPAPWMNRHYSYDIELLLDREWKPADSAPTMKAVQVIADKYAKDIAAGKGRARGVRVVEGSYRIFLRTRRIT